MNEILSTPYAITNDYELDTEVNTGKTWYDGSYIYRIVNKYENTKVVEKTTNIIDNSRFNIRQIIHSEAILYTKSDDDCFFLLPSPFLVGGNYPEIRYYYRNHGNIIAYYNEQSYYIGGYVIFITEYIKN